MATSRTTFILGLAFGVALGGASFFAVHRLRGLGPPRTFDLRQDLLERGNADLKEVAITFDDGPHPETKRILDELRAARAKATFFVVGKMIDKDPALVRRLLYEGHEVGNHTFDHLRLEGRSREMIREDIAQCQRAFYRVTGAEMNLFRPPGMRYDDTVIRAAQDLGYVTVHWNVAAKDFQPKAPSEIASTVLHQVRPGSVILLHNHPDTAKALPAILNGLEALGYRTVRVSQMLARLPRPVVIRSNAFGVKLDVVARIAKTEARKPRQRKGVEKRYALRQPKGSIPVDAGRKKAPIPSGALQ
ncbi:MAG: polysaccharide deacetylase family protein [Armatimonadetes bacterium]|nr:polysaccharide deacetylase family protein [Armatimonadota bacterium]